MIGTGFRSDHTIVGRVWRSGSCSFLLQPRNLIVSALLVATMLSLATIAMTFGRSELPLSQILSTLAGFGTGDTDERVIVHVRLPRVLAALFVGAALGLSGLVFQSISRNALGSPDVIGFTTGAATGALAQIIVFGHGSVPVALAAVGGGVFTAIVVYLLAARGGVVAGPRLILVGIGVGSILAALNSLMLVKGHLDNAISANLWLAGSLDARTWGHVLPVLIGTVALLPLILLSARRLSLIEMGDDLARQLGIVVERTRLIMVFCAVVLAALATGATGPIAFIALAAAPLARRVTKATHLPVIAAAAMGSCLLLAADLITQSLPTGIVVPIGRMTGVVGGVYLLWLLTRSRRP